jgi:hypothetical protein
MRGGKKMGEIKVRRGKRVGVGLKAFKSVL